MLHAWLLCALLLPVEVRAWAANLLNNGRCSRGLGVGEDQIMMRDQQQGSEQVFVKAQCGGTFSGAGFTLGVDMASASQWTLEVEGGTISSSDSGIECGCGGVRCATSRAVTKSEASFTVATTGDEVTVRLGYSRVYGAVIIAPACTLTRGLAAPPSPPQVPNTSPSPPSPPSPPPPSPPPPPATPTVHYAWKEGLFELTWSVPAVAGEAGAADAPRVGFRAAVNKEAWTGVGLSSDGTMTSGGDGTPAVVAQFSGGVGFAAWYSLSEYSMEGVGAVEDVVDAADAGQTDGKSWVRFTVPYVRAAACADAGVAVCAGEKLKMVIAHGGTNAFDGSLHTKAITIELDVENGGVTLVGLNRMYAAHGALMGIAWLGIAPIGALVARFAKGPSGMWFKAHVCLQASAVTLTIVGFAIALVMVRRHFNGTHTVMGVFVFCGAVVQAAGGLLRPHKDKSADVQPLVRRVWEYGHRGFGNAMWVIALATACLGLARLDEMTDLRSATASEGAAYVYIGVALAAVWGGAFVALQGKRILAGGSRADKVAA